MAEDNKEPWQGQMALATVIVAVCATLSTFKGGSYSTQSVVNQAQASDQWAFYQAKSMKQHLFELQAEQLQLQALALPAHSTAKARYEQKITEYRASIERYAQEKKEIEGRAKELEARRDEAKRHNQPFGIAVILLQIAILLTSVAGLMKMKWIWWLAIPLGLAGIGYFTDGFLAIF